MSYFSGQSLHPPVPNPPLNYQSDVPPHFQSLSSGSSFSDPYHVFNPYSDSGVYPSNYEGYVGQPINHLDNNGISPSWVVKQAAPIKYSPAIQPLRTEAMASTSYGAPVNYNVVGKKMINKVPKKNIKRLKVTPNKSSVSQNVRCELCKIDCNTVQVYEKHLSGKKHSKVLQKCYAPALQSAALQASQSNNSSRSAGEVVTPSVQGVPGVPTKPANLEAKKQKLLEGGTAIQAIRVCTICNVTCNGEIAFADHLVGKKHASQQRAQATAMNINTVGINAQDSITKKRKNGESASLWCDVCKISCTSSDGLNIHLVGKKHQKNLEKLQNSNSNTINPASTPASLPSTNSSTGVELNTDPNKTSSPNSDQAKKVRSKEPKDVEMKKRNILECGAASDAVRTCTICNVVCNSETVFKSHLTGQKHAAMVKQAQGASASKGLEVVYPTS